MSTYYTLVVERDYLKNVGPLDTVATDGHLIQADLTRAESDAFNEINSLLAADYDVSTWASSTPPIIADIANLLASANVWMMRHAADSMGVAGNPEGLRAWALKKIEEIKGGNMQIVLASGSIQRKRLGDGEADLTA